MSGLGARGAWSIDARGTTSSPEDRTDTTKREAFTIGFEDQGSSSGPTTARLDFEPGGARMRLFDAHGSPPEEAWFAPIQGGWDPTVGCGEACSPDTHPGRDGGFDDPSGDGGFSGDDASGDGGFSDEDGGA